jgi:hypothetical protein
VGANIRILQILNECLQNPISNFKDLVIISLYIIDYAALKSNANEKFNHLLIDYFGAKKN